MTPEDLDALDRQIQANEGWRSYVYDDATGERITKGSTVIGHPTLGYGFNLDAIELPQNIGDAWFEALRARVMRDIFDVLPWASLLPAGPLRAVIDIAYNSGTQGLLGFHHLIDALQRRDFPAASKEVVNSKLSPPRAQRLAALILS